MVGRRASAALRYAPLWPQSGALDGVDGAHDPVEALVEGVVGGDGAAVVAGAADSAEDLLRGGEARISLVRAAGRGEGCLQVAESEVRAGDGRAQAGEDRREVGPVVAAVGLGLFPDRRVDQDVAGGEDADPPVVGRGPPSWAGGAVAGVVAAAHGARRRSRRWRSVEGCRPCRPGWSRRAEVPGRADGDHQGEEQAEQEPVGEREPARPRRTMHSGHWPRLMWQ